MNEEYLKLKEHQVRLNDGTIKIVTADDIKFVGNTVYKVVGQKWTEIYRKDEVRGVYVKK